MHPGLLGPSGTRLGGKEACGRGGAELCIFVTDIGEDPPSLSSISREVRTMLRRPSDPAHWTENAAFRKTCWGSKRSDFTLAPKRQQSKHAWGRVGREKEEAVSEEN